MTQSSAQRIVHPNPFNSLFLYLLIISSLIAGYSTFAAEKGASQVGTITQTQGVVKLFNHPSRTLQTDSKSHAPHALFEGEYFQVEEVKPGTRVEEGNILRTAPGSKARVLFDNGDQFNVGPSTAYRVNWVKNSKGVQTQIDLKYGKIRGIIEKGGPRSHLQIRTKTAVMGVRGTDFFIAQGGPDNGTHVSIIRGAVELAHSPKAKPIQVAAGFSAETTAAPTAQAPVEVSLRKTTQEDYAGIQKSSTLEHRSLASSADTPPELKEKLAFLEKSATKVVLQDIKAENKALYESLEKKLGPEGLASLASGSVQPGISIDDINRAAIHEVSKNAPKAPPAHKPYKSELEDLENGAYDRYLKGSENP